MHSDGRTDGLTGTEEGREASLERKSKAKANINQSIGTSAVRQSVRRAMRRTRARARHAINLTLDWSGLPTSRPNLYKRQEGDGGKFEPALPARAEETMNQPLTWSSVTPQFLGESGEAPGARQVWQRVPRRRRSVDDNLLMPRKLRDYTYYKLASKVP